MQKVTVDLDKLKEERAKHELAIKQIDTIIAYYFPDSTNPDSAKDSTPDSFELNSSEKTRTERAMEICEEYLKEGHIVTSTKQFIELARSKGVHLSRAGFSFAFKKPDSKIYFDKKEKFWKLKK